MDTHSHTYGYKLSGFFLEYGPIKADSLAAAKVQIRQRLGVNRLPVGVRIWDLAERPLTRWRVDALS
jgi:hypothetical protein